jgi:putative endonuclease
MAGSSPAMTAGEKELMKRWSRRWKLDLIEKNNPEWVDLFDTLV